MTNAKSTKRAFLASVIAMLLCFTMLLGTTYAWFTDSVTNSGNKIVAGTLDVQLLMDADRDGNYDDISDNTSPIFGDGSIAQDNNAETLWEPGKTQVAYLAIRNNGNLDLKYTVGLTVNNVSKDLYKVMEYDIVENANATTAPVTSWVDGEGVQVGAQSVSGDVALAKGVTHYFALVIHMDEDAGNDYMGGQVNFDLTVLATQLTSESDSFNNQYDKDADYATTVGSKEVLSSAMTAGGKVVLSDDIDASTESVVAADGTALDLGGKELSVEYLTSGGSASISNGTLTMPTDGYVYAEDGGNVTLENVVIESEDLSVFAYTGGTLTLKDVTLSTTSTSNPVQNYGGTLILDGVTASQAGDAQSAWYSSAIQVINQIAKDSATGKWQVVSQANTIIESGNYSGKKAIMISAPGGNVTVNGGTFVGTEAVIQADFSPNNYIDGSNFESVITINGGDFTGKIKAAAAVKLYINGGNFDGTFDVKAGTELVIKGGTFTVDPTAYLAAGYVATESNGVWTVTTI